MIWIAAGARETMSSAQVGNSIRDVDDDPIVISLVNDMPDAALRTTEQQSRSYCPRRRLVNVSS